MARPDAPVRARAAAGYRTGTRVASPWDTAPRAENSRAFDARVRYFGTSYCVGPPGCAALGLAPGVAENIRASLKKSLDPPREEVAVRAVTEVRIWLISQRRVSSWPRAENERERPGPPLRRRPIAIVHSQLSARHTYQARV